VLLGLHCGLAAALMVDKITLGRSRIKMSSIGSIRETQAVIDLCAAHRIYPDISVVPVAELNAVFARLDGSNESGLRYVLDLASLTEDAACTAPAPALSPYDGNFTIPNAVFEMLGLLFLWRWW
jgi:hypothetical protein